MFEIDVRPFEAEQLASPQSCCQLHIVHLEYIAVFRFSKERCQLLHWESFHLPMFQLRQGAALGGIGGDDFLLLRQLHGRGDDLVDVSHGLGTEAFCLAFALDPVNSPTVE